MKKVFTLMLVMAMAITGFAQVKSMTRQANKDLKTAQTRTVTGLETEEVTMPFSPITPKSVMTIAPEEEFLPYLVNDWWTGGQQKNWTAVWPDGFAVNCFETGLDEANLADNGTGLAWFDPATGEWDYTDGKIQSDRVFSHSIARYKENGLVAAAYNGDGVYLYINEDFRNGGEWSTGILVPAIEGHGYRSPVVQCSGETPGSPDIIHIIYYDAAETSLAKFFYAKYERGEWVETHRMIEQINEARVGGSYPQGPYFMLYDEEHPTRVSFMSNGTWRDGSLIISEDNGETWNERMFYQHPGVHTTFSLDDTLTGGDGWFFFPRMTSAAFDANDHLHLIYEYNGSIGEPGSGSYYPSLGGVAYWSEILPKNALCEGGTGSVGAPFRLDHRYLQNDLYYSEWYWSDGDHDPLPEYFGELEFIDPLEGYVIPRDVEGGVWPGQSEWGSHAYYNQGKAGYPTMYFDKGTNRVIAFWSMICGSIDDNSYCTDGMHEMRLFGNVGQVESDGTITWDLSKHLLLGFENSMIEQIYNQVVPFLYTDDQGEYVWVCYNADYYPGSYYWDEDPDPTDNNYRAIKVYISYVTGAEEGETMTVATTLDVYPNPAQGSFVVSLNNESDINIYNAVGQLVKTFNNVKEANVELEAGVYFVNANNQTKKVVVK